MLVIFQLAVSITESTCLDAMSMTPVASVNIISYQVKPSHSVAAHHSTAVVGLVAKS